jgi:hypothetical protein
MITGYLQRAPCVADLIDSGDSCRDPRNHRGQPNYDDIFGQSLGTGVSSSISHREIASWDLHLRRKTQLQNQRDSFEAPAI